MKKRILGKTLEVSAVGLGCMGFTHAYGEPMEENEAVRAIREAVEMGYTFFDTAHRYVGARPDGSRAYNEELLGKALAPYKGKVKIATKCGIHVDEKGRRVVDSRPETIRRELEMSLRQLGVEAIDLYYQHRPDPNIPVEEVAGLMAGFIREGKILHWGVSEMSEADIRRAHAVCPITCTQNRLSMMARWNESFFPLLEELGIGFVAFSPLANGFLSDAYQGVTFTGAEDFRTHMPQFRQENRAASEELLALVRKIADEKGATPAQLSLAWLLAKKPYIVPIPGSRKAERLRENAGAAEVVLTDSEMAALDGLLEKVEMPVYGGSSLLAAGEPLRS